VAQSMSDEAIVQTAAMSLVDSLGMEEDVNRKAYHESDIIDTDRGVCDDRTSL
jgi:hypothetical protein